MRVVLDANVWISGFISAHGAPAAILRRIQDGEIEPVVAGFLLAEIEASFEDRWLRSRVLPEEAAGFLGLVRALSTMVPDPAPISRLSRDPDDDRVVALALQAGAACVVTGDGDLLDIQDPPVPVISPRRFLDAVEGG